jgi:hypothetical protein
MMDVREFLEHVTRMGLEYFQIYPGVYRGVVTRNDDPLKRGRIQARVPGVGQAQAPDIWIKPSMQGAGASRGQFWPPEVGDAVMVSFAQGRASRPETYWGGWYGAPSNTNDVPIELGYGGGDYPVIRGFVTRMGQALIFSDKDGDERVELHWNKPASDDDAKNDRTKSAARPGDKAASFKFKNDGTIEMLDAAGQKCTFDATAESITLEDANGNQVVLDSNGILFKSEHIFEGAADAMEKAILGNKFLQKFLQHKHGTAMGPSGPPIEPVLEAEVLSNVVKIK